MSSCFAATLRDGAKFFFNRKDTARHFEAIMKDTSNPVVSIQEMNIYNYAKDAKIVFDNIERERIVTILKSLNEEDYAYLCQRSGMIQDALIDTP